MKLTETLFAGCLILLLSAPIASFAQEKEEADKAAKQEEAKPAEKPAEMKDRSAQETKRADENQAKEQKNEEKQTKEGKKQQENDAKHSEKEQGNERKDQTRASSSGTENHRAQSTQKIPDDKFRAHFGREHHFRVSQPVIVQGRPRIQYSGYFFEFVDPWPVDWSYSDDCYIDYIDGEYFLFDLAHPGVRLALVVVL